MAPGPGSPALRRSCSLLRQSLTLPRPCELLATLCDAAVTSQTCNKTFREGPAQHFLEPSLASPLLQPPAHAAHHTFQHFPLSSLLPSLLCYPEVPTAAASRAQVQALNAVDGHISTRSYSTAVGSSPAQPAAVDASPGAGVDDTGATEIHVRQPTVAELDGLFRTKAAPLGTGPNPKVAVSRASGVSGLVLSALGFYGKESQLIRGARALYSQIQHRADDPQFLAAFGLAPSFRASHAMLLLHTWLCLVRLRSEATKSESNKADAAEVGQTLYELFNHDCEKRVVAAGVTVLVSRWMKELEKSFYGACIAFDRALKPEADRDALEQALWRNILSEGETDLSSTNPSSAAAARALARYVRLQLASLSMTGSDAFLTGNIQFTSLRT